MACWFIWKLSFSFKTQGHSLEVIVTEVECVTLVCVTWTERFFAHIFFAVQLVHFLCILYLIATHCSYGTQELRQLQPSLDLMAMTCVKDSLEFVSHTLLIILIKLEFVVKICHMHTHPFNGPFPGTTQVSRYQKGKTNLDFTEARDSEWQWHQLGHMQVCTLLQTDNHTSTPPLCFLQTGCPSCCPTNNVKALKALM